MIVNQSKKTHTTDLTQRQAPDNNKIIGRFTFGLFAERGAGFSLLMQL